MYKQNKYYLWNHERVDATKSQLKKLIYLCECVCVYVCVLNKTDIFLFFLFCCCFSQYHGQSNSYNNELSWKLLNITITYNICFFFCKIPNIKALSSNSLQWLDLWGINNQILIFFVFQWSFKFPPWTKTYFQKFKRMEYYVYVEELSNNPYCLYSLSR